MNATDAASTVRSATQMALAAALISITAAISFFVEAVLLETRQEIEFTSMLFVVLGAPGVAYLILSHYLRRCSTTAVRLLVGLGMLHCLTSLLGAVLVWFMMNGDLVEAAARVLLFAFLLSAGAAEATAIFAKRAAGALAV